MTILRVLFLLKKMSPTVSTSDPPAFSMETMTSRELRSTTHAIVIARATFQSSKTRATKALGLQKNIGFVGLLSSFRDFNPCVLACFER